MLGLEKGVHPVHIVKAASALPDCRQKNPPKLNAAIAKISHCEPVGSQTDGCVRRTDSSIRKREPVKPRRKWAHGGQHGNIGSARWFGDRVARSGHPSGVAATGRRTWAIRVGELSPRCGSVALKRSTPPCSCVVTSGPNPQFAVRCQPRPRVCLSAHVASSSPGRAAPSAIGSRRSRD